MSKQLTANAIASFDAQVKKAYEKGGLVRNCVRVKTGITGSTHRFDVFGKGTATKRTPQTDVVPMNVVHARQTAILEDWNAPEYTDIFDQKKVHWDEKSNLATTVAMAIGRREDQMIIDAMDAASTTLTVSDDVGGTNTGLNTTKCRRAKRLLDDQAVPGGERYALISAYGLEQLLGDDDANTIDKNTIKALFDGEIIQWLGFKFKVIETRSEGGLALASNIRKNFFFDKMAIGLAVGLDFRTEINYIAQKTSWLVNGIFSAGATHIDANGIVEMDTYEA